MTVVLWLAVGLPALTALCVRLAPRAAGALAAVGAALAAVPAVALLVGAAGGERHRTGFVWLPATPDLGIGLRLDPLSAVMATTVALVGLAVVLYSAGYFAAEPRRPSGLAGCSPSWPPCRASSSPSGRRARPRPAPAVRPG